MEDSGVDYIYKSFYGDLMFKGRFIPNYAFLGRYYEFSIPNNGVSGKAILKMRLDYNKVRSNRNIILLDSQLRP